MTLLVAVLTPDYILHVSDRLVTHNARYTSTGELQSAQAYDRGWNKLALVGASDAVVAINYAGAATLGRIPSDDWIASIIDPEAYAHGGTRFGARSSNMDLGMYVKMAATKLNELANRGQIAAPILFQITGYQWNRRNRRIRPIYWELRHDGKRGHKSTFGRLERYWGWQTRRVMKTYVEGDLRGDPLGHIQRELALLPDKRIEAVEELAIDLIRRASNATPAVVGSDCMVIRLEPHKGIIRISYVPAVPTAFYDFYGCWIMFRGLAVRPSVEQGGFARSYQVGELKILLERVGQDPSLQGPSWGSSINTHRRGAPRPPDSRSVPSS